MIVALVNAYMLQTLTVPLLAESVTTISGSKVTAILLKGWIWPTGGVASGRVFACSLRSRLFDKPLLNELLVFVEQPLALRGSANKTVT